MPFKDKAAKRAYDRKYYQEKIDKPKRRTQIHERRKRLKSFVATYLQTHPCVDCGEDDPIVLDFDHQRDKELEIANAVKQGWSIERIEKEIAKCQVRCADCHRRKTVKDRNNRV